MSSQCPPECSILSLLNTSHLASGISVKFNSVGLDGLSLVCRGGPGNYHLNIYKLSIRQLVLPHVGGRPPSGIHPVAPTQVS